MTAHVVINGQEVPWSFIHRIRRVMGGDWDSTIDAFWRARKATGENAVIRYLVDGLKPDAKGNRYTMICSKERERGEMERIRRWWNTEVYASQKAPRSIGQILSEMASEYQQGKSVRPAGRVRRAGHTGAQGGTAADAESIAMTL